MTALATLRRRRITGLGLAVALLGLALIASIAIGARAISPGTIYDALTEAFSCPNGAFRCAATSTEAEIIRGLRLPRTALGLVTGLALGIAGALIQGYTRNPMADAGLLGINAGAAFFAAGGMYLFAFTAPEQYIWLAFLGAFLAGVTVFGISSFGGGTASPLSLILAGAALTAFLQALTNAIITLDTSALDSYRFWVVGEISGRDAEIFWQALLFISVGAVLAVAVAPGLNLLGLGADVARGLGVHLGRNRTLGLIAVVLLCGAATAAVGPIAFIGLVIPHIARACTGPDHRWLIPYSGLFGAIGVLIADTAGRIVARPGELPVGLMVAAIGAPFFIALVRRRKVVQL